MARILFLILQLVTTLVPLAGIIILIFRHQGRGSMHLLIASIGALIMNTAYLQQLLASSEEVALSTMKIQYVGNVMFYLAFVLFVLNYFNFRPRRGNLLPFILWVGIDTCTLVAIWVDRYNSFMYRDIEFMVDEMIGSIQVATTQGTIYLIRNCILSAILFSCFIFSLVKAVKVKVRMEKFNILRISGVIIITLAALVVSQWVQMRFDIVPVSASAAMLFLVIFTTRGGLFDNVDLGSRWVQHNMHSIFIVTDSEFGFLEACFTAYQYFPELSSVGRNERIPDRIFALLYEDSLSEDFDNIIELEGCYFERMRTALVNSKQKKIGYVLLLKDVSSQYQLMTDLEEARVKADAANEAKSSFLSNMSHEIRTPMNAIVGMTEILMRSELPSQEMEYLANIKSSGDALLNIINDILDFSKIESGKLEIVEEEYAPMSLFHDLGMIFLNRIGTKPVEMLYDIDVDLPVKLYGDALRLRQIIINITNNAIKFTEEGSVRLEVRQNHIEGDDLELSFRITDTGQGIKEEDLGKLFGTFSQVDSVKNHSKEGTGLGLAISKQLVERMGGHIGVESEYGKGSTFFFTVHQRIVDATPATRIHEEHLGAHVGGRFRYPKSSELFGRLVADSGLGYAEGYASEANPMEYFFTDIPEEMTSDEQAYFKTHGTEVIILQNPMTDNLSGSFETVINKPLFSLNFCQSINHEKFALGTNDEQQLFTAPEAKILLVDDNEMNLKVAIGMLEPLKLQIDTAENGKQAIEMTMAGQYDAVFMDHMMPVMDGVEATKRLRAMDSEYAKKIPVIALTANAVQEIRDQYFEAGMNDFVAKPIKMKEIVKSLRTWLPAGKIHELTASDVEAMAQTGEDTAAADKPVIPELDVDEGIANCGSLKMYLDCLRDFYKLMDLKVTKLGKCLDDGLIRDYTIEVHALKNTARMVGDAELSAMFLRAEQLGNAGEVDTIRAEHEALMARYTSLKPILEPYAASTQNLKEASVEEVKGILTRISEAMDAFDLDVADAAMKELEGIAVPEAIREDTNRLAALMADVAIEEVIALCAELGERLG